MILPDLLVQLPQNPWVSIGLHIAVGTLSGLPTRRAVRTWYPRIAKPPGEPPRLAFPVVWTALYGAMGYAAHLLTTALAGSVSPVVKQSADLALKLHYLQLGLNFIWTPLFFGLRAPPIALVDILVLTPTVYKLVNEALKVDQRAGYLYIPYAIWLSYATYLNAGIVYLNQW